MYLDEIFGLKGKVAVVTGGSRGIGQVVGWPEQEQNLSYYPEVRRTRRFRRFLTQEAAGILSKQMSLWRKV